MTLICIVPEASGWAIEFPEEQVRLKIAARKYDALEDALEIARSNPPCTVRIMDARARLEQELRFDRPGSAPEEAGIVMRGGAETAGEAT